MRWTCKKYQSWTFTSELWLTFAAYDTPYPSRNLPKRPPSYASADKIMPIAEVPFEVVSTKPLLEIPVKAVSALSTIAVSQLELVPGS
jgi:hypothetical protein